ncbi:MAG: hypothetical protein HYV63_00280, partial [Candidatus Schekmanbacteria bacterium]|nr:hypothetical protein [Candidatus Schekmanbacteria bacterium]
MKTDDGTGSRAAFDERRRHLEALVELNRKAGVDPEVIDLIEAYARL